VVKCQKKVIVDIIFLVFTASCISNIKDVFKGVSKDVFRWVGQSLPIGLEGWNHFLCFGKMVKTKRGNRIRHLI
jgi:hypothetical protein